MKKTILICTFLFSLFVTLNAQGNLSFRNTATGGAIQDDLDLVIDPIELKFVDGMRVYSNLSNLTSQNEELMDNLSDNEFLFGISAENPFVKNLWNSVFIGFQNTEDPDSVAIDIDLNGVDDLFGIGVLEGGSTSYTWDQVNEEYSHENVITQKNTDIDKIDGSKFILNNTWDKNGLVLGGRLSMISNGNSGTEADEALGTGSGLLFGVNAFDPTFQHDQSKWDLINNEFDFEVTEEGDFSTENNFSNTNVLLSAMLPEFMDMEVRGNVSFSLESDVMTINDSYSGTEDKEWNAVTTGYDDRYTESASNEESMEEKGSRFGLGGTVRKTFEEGLERKNDGFWSAGFNFEFGSFDYENSDVEKFSSTDYTTNLQEVVINQTKIKDDSGTNSVINFGIFYHINIPLADNALFAIGGAINGNSENRETDYEESFNKVTDTEVLDGVTNDSDTKKTVTEGLEADRTFESATTVFRAPVGLEYKIGKKQNWALRFGSVFTKTKVATTDKREVTNVDIREEITEYGGNQDDDIVYPFGHDYQEDVMEEETIDIWSNTMFSYGIGYTPLKNLQVDLLGYFGTQNNSILDAEFYRNLRLSFTLKFF